MTAKGLAVKMLALLDRRGGRETLWLCRGWGVAALGPNEGPREGRPTRRGGQAGAERWGSGAVAPALPCPPATVQEGSLPQQEAVPWAATLVLYGGPSGLSHSGS